MQAVAPGRAALAVTSGETVWPSVMDQDWCSLSLLHWRYDPAVVRPLLPAGLSVETCDGSAWVSLVPFLLRVRIPYGPAIPWLGVFPETNVRTYVRGPDGRSGIWFLSLDAPRRLAIRVAQQTYGLPYRLASMRMRVGDGVRHYASWRLSGANRGASSRAVVRPGERIRADELTELDAFLTARWRLYSRCRGGGVGVARVEHAPFALCRAGASDVDARLLVAAGLPHAAGVPLVHACADDVRAHFTPLRRCRADSGDSDG